MEKRKSNKGEGSVYFDKKRNCWYAAFRHKIASGKVLTKKSEAFKTEKDANVWGTTQKNAEI